MFRTKKDVDKQVRSMLSKIREDEKPLRGYKIALMYFKIGEYDSAVEYLKRYIMADDKHSAAYKMLGQCYEKLKRPDKQLEAYQRSLELDKKQTDLLVEVCKLMQNNELSDVTPAKARYWYEMAESRNIHDSAVLNLKLKFSQPGDNVAIQDIILKEIVRRPFDSGLRIRLVQHYLDQKRIDDAFQYVHDLEIQSIPKFRNSSEWYATVTQVLDKYKEKYSASIHKNWPYWLMLITVLERQLFLALSRTPKDFNSINQNFATAGALLFEFDQHLNKAATSCSFPDAERDLASEFLAHFRGQLCLHATSLLFKRESEQSMRDTWLQTTKMSLPLLLLAFNCGSVNKNQQWLRTASETTVQLIDAWHSQSNFRLSQSGRTLQSCISASTTADNNAVLANLRKIGLDNKYSLWSNKDDLLNEIRSTVADTDWRKKIYRILFKNKEHLDAASGSHFLKSRALETPTFDWPDLDALSTLEDNAQSAEPSSLSHMVYLTLARNNTWKDKTITINPDSRCVLFNKLSFSTQNLLNCSAESLNQLDIDTFVYAATIQAKRKLTLENSILNVKTPNETHKPKMLPFANMASDLATEDQSDWFEAAYKVYNNASGDDLAAIRATLQHGIEAVRGVGNPKMDLIILLKLGQLFSKRAQNSTKSIERSFFEDRSEALFKFSLQMLRMQNASRSNESAYRRLFKFATGSSYFEIDSEVNSLAEEAITFLAGRYFRNNAFEECVEDFAGIKLPFATYFQAESYRKMTEFSNTPKKNKRAFLDKARDCLKQTVDLLDGPNADKNHPLKSIIDGDIERLQNEARKLETNQTMTDSFVSANGRSDLDDSNDRMDRETEVATPVPQANYDNLERLIRQVIESLAILKDDVNEKMTEINERLQDIEDSLNKEQDDIPSVDEDDYSYVNDQTRPNANDTSMMVNVSRNTARTPKERQGGSNQQQSRSQMLSQSHQSPMVGMNNSFNPLYPGFYGQMPFNPYQAGNMASMNPVLPYNELMNYNLQQQFLAQQLAADTRNVSLLGLLNSPLPQSPQVHSAVPAQVALPLAMNNPLATTSNVTPLQQSSSSHAAPSIASVQTPSQGIITTPVIPAGQKPWSASMNNQPVEKGPPVNVVITNSDRLPSSNITTPSTVSFSVTIPPQHIKINPAVPVTGAAVKNPSIVAALQDKKTPQSNITLNSTTQSTATVPTSQEQKSIFGNLSKPFSSTPFGSPSSSLSTSISSATKPTEKSQTEATKSPFSGFSFVQPPTKMESPFAKLNQTESSAPTDPAKSNDETVSTSVVNASKEEEVDIYEPTAHFEPVIPLPDLVEVKTGEENETTLFEHRAKLLRYVKESKEWKERGIGTMKVMVNKDDPNKVRLLMRRDQVLKLCCNQMLTKDTKFNKMPNNQTALSWFGQDYSENELQVEMLAIRFKTAEVCEQFHAAVLNAQEKMTDGATTSKSLNKEPLLSNPVQNKAQAKSEVKGFGDQFKPKAGSWNCEACYISNKETDKVCCACGTSKDKNAPVAEQNKAAASAPTFSFGNLGAGAAQKPATTTTTTSSVFGNLSLTSTNANKPSPVVPATNPAAQAKGFGDQFKPKPGSWSCKACYTSNTGENLYCLACEEPKDDTVPKKGTQNTFGSANVSAAPLKPTFSFGSLGGAAVSPQTTISANSSAFGSSTFNFSLGSQSFNQSKPANESNVPQLDSKEFSFVFKSKSPAKAQANITGVEDVSDDENVEEEENNTYFAPVIPLPEKIEVKSGEEDEDVLYTHRAKLYRFRDKEWRERGLGDIKILRHKQTGKLRVVMRREQIQKICLNHVLVPEIEYKVKDGKSWQFVVSDFSEGVLETDNFCIRFKTDEIALDFKKAIDGALNGSLEPIQLNGETVDDHSGTETLTAEERQSLTDLKLPKDFFNYKKKEQCTGCRGCKSDDFVFSEVKDTNFGQSDDNPLSFAAPPPQKPANDLSKSNQNSLFSIQPNTTNFAPPTGSIFGGNSFKTISSFGSGDASKQTFSFGQTNNSFGTKAEPLIFGHKTTPAAPQFGSPRIFGGNTNGTDVKSSSGFSFKLGPSTTANNDSPATPASETKTTSTPIFGEKASLSFGDLAAKATPPNNNNSTNNTSSNFSFASLAKAANQDQQTDSPLFSGVGGSFADLAKSAETAQSAKNSFSFNNTPTKGGFFGLSNKHTFNNLMQPSLNGSANSSNQKDETAGNDDNVAEDPNYDPHYEPIIALPDEIQVSTGEEEEQKLFGERAKLFRFDATNKEWKERGVGEIKILYHPVNKSYRLLLRREQIHKLVLNTAITSEFQMNPMKQSDKAFCWVAQNYAEDQENGALESLSVRFKNAALADKFNAAIQNGIAQLKARGDLEPQDD